MSEAVVSVHEVKVKAEKSETETDEVAEDAAAAPTAKADDKGASAEADKK